MRFPRAAGILLHPTSLPGPHGIGDLGPDAHRFLDVLTAMGCTLWQMLPLGPTGYGNSPYQCFSAFAGNPLLVHVPDVTMHSSTDHEAHDPHRVPFPRVMHEKTAAVAALADRVPRDDAYHAFVDEQAWWLDDYALFMALKATHDGAVWTSWPAPYAHRDPEALARFRETHAAQIERICMEQFLVVRQFATLRDRAHALGITLMGDVPIYVAHDSADVWAHRHLFQLDADGAPRVQAGVPPDYFSATGQLWGNPLYDWAAMAQDGYAWWIARMRAALTWFDRIRLDHFRGFDAYWEVPGRATTAERGQWVPGPGAALFDALTDALGPLPIVAENLGLITPTVEALRETYDYPGMSVLQFAFSNEGEPNTFLPHRHVPNQVVYTGTHDNDTTVGWWTEAAGADSTREADAIAREHDFARRYLQSDGQDMPWPMIRAALASVADTAIVPLQDVLGLGSAARMNRPGSAAGNWQFRFSWAQCSDDAVARMRSLVRLYER